jgi:hypothetical protein
MSVASGMMERVNRLRDFELPSRSRLWQQTDNLQETHDYGAIQVMVLGAYPGQATGRA